MKSFGDMADNLGIPKDEIRVRSDGDALEFLKKHQAIAAAIDASTIFVRPEAQSSNAVMAHELMHIAQLRRGEGGTSESTELAAHVGAQTLSQGETPKNIGNAAAPPLFLTFTGGAFDQALTNLQPSDDVVKALKKSSAFMHIVHGLDAHYVWLNDPKFSNAGVDMPHGVLASGPFKGRRVLFVQPGAEQGSFSPFDSPDNPISADLMKIAGGDTIKEVRSIAHEATHAFHVVTGTHAPPVNIEDAIAGGITEEIETRKSEVAIVKQAFGTKSTQASAIEAEVAAGYLERPFVERDIAPDIGLTYLESAGFAALLDKYQKAEGLTDKAAADLRDSMDKGPKRFPTFRNARGFEDPSRYALTYVNRKIAIATWEKFRSDYSGREHTNEAKREKERQLQENARVLLEGFIRYSPLPTP